LRVLLEATPSHVEVDRMVEALLEVSGVKDVHDLHVWSITPEMHAMSCHILIADQAVSQAATIQQGIEELLSVKFKISHSTLQLECHNCEVGGVMCSLGSGHDGYPDYKNGVKAGAEALRDDIGA
jgi:cobalt-zinc-cadmium efflux system protein